MLEGWLGVTGSYTSTSLAGLHLNCEVHLLLRLQFECTPRGEWPPGTSMMAGSTSGCGTDRLKRELASRFGYTDFKSKLQERAVVAINEGIYVVSWGVCKLVCVYCGG